MAIPYALKSENPMRDITARYGMLRQPLGELKAGRGCVVVNCGR